MSRLIARSFAATIRVGKVSAGDGIAAVSYDTPYAVRQHEDLTLAHDAGRRAKWLERAAMEEAGVIEQILADEIRKALQGGSLL